MKEKNKGVCEDCHKGPKIKLKLLLSLHVVSRHLKYDISGPDMPNDHLVTCTIKFNMKMSKPPLTIVPHCPHTHTSAPTHLDITAHLSIVADHVHAFISTVNSYSDHCFQQDNILSQSSNHLRLVEFIIPTVTRSQSNTARLLKRDIGIINE